MSAEETAKKLRSIFSDEVIEKADQYRSALMGVDGAIRKLSNMARIAMEPISAIDSGIGSSQASTEAFNKSIDITSKNLAQIAQFVSKDAAAAFLAIGKTIVETNKEMTRLGQELDAGTKNIRSTRDEFYKLGAAFGESYDKTQDLRRGLGNLAEDISTRSVVSFQDMKEAVKSAGNSYGSAALHYSEFFKEIDTGTEKFSALESAILLNRRSGEGLGQTMRFLAEAVKKSGVSIEDAVSQYSSFFDIAEKTGLKFDEVRTSLSSVANQYSKIGINAEFARPIIETFSRSLSEAGLGVSNATNLSENLSRSLMQVAGSYEKAYLMVQKGGLDVGTRGGGVLGSSIAMRANIMDAEDAGEQSEMGLQMAESMKKTLESMSGGNLVDIREARDNPALSSTYFKQESLMSSMYGMDKDTAARTIEMLKKLDDTTVMSNKDLRENLGKNLEDQLKNQDENIGYQERIEANTSNMFASSVLTNEILMKIATGSNRGAAGVANIQSAGQEALFDPGMDMATELAESSSDMVAQAENKMVTMQRKLDMMFYDTKNQEDYSAAAANQGGSDKLVPEDKDISDVFTKGDEAINTTLKSILRALDPSNPNNTYGN